VSTTATGSRSGSGEPEAVSEQRPAEAAGAIREWPFGAVLAVVVVGLVIVASGHFRGGCVVVGAGASLAAVLRAMLPERRAGLLVVRHRFLDVVLMTALGVGIVVLAVVVPPGR
jgi:Protein of unknown function (DUF3017)